VVESVGVIMKLTLALMMVFAESGIVALNWLVSVKLLAPTENIVGVVDPVV
jgi:hypothetical protein